MSIIEELKAMMEQHYKMTADQFLQDPKRSDVPDYAEELNEDRVDEIVANALVILSGEAVREVVYNLCTERELEDGTKDLAIEILTKQIQGAR